MNRAKKFCSTLRDRELPLDEITLAVLMEIDATEEYICNRNRCGYWQGSVFQIWGQETIKNTQKHMQETFLPALKRYSREKLPDWYKSPANTIFPK